MVVMATLEASPSSIYSSIPLQHPSACIKLSKTVIANNISVNKMAKDWRRT
jgi:hypothetical protein